MKKIIVEFLKMVGWAILALIVIFIQLGVFGRTATVVCSTIIAVVGLWLYFKYLIPYLFGKNKDKKDDTDDKEEES